jgi:hypothetical protein
MMTVADALSIGLYILPIVYFRFERLTQHYTGLFLMLVVLVMVRYLLRRGFPKHDAFVRPNGVVNVPAQCMQVGCRVVIWLRRCILSPATIHL